MMFMDITSMIADTQVTGGEVWVFSDLHLLKKKGTPRIFSRDRVIDTFKRYLENITDKDLIIFMGDFVDDTIEYPLMIQALEIFNGLKKNKKVWIRGNNDMFGDRVLELDGWKVCYSAFAVIDTTQVIFSHTSLDMSSFEAVYNVHGHMHRDGDGEMLYYHNPKGCVNIAPACNLGYGFKLDEIMDMIDSHTWDQYGFYPGEEKPGMSRFIKNMAEIEAADDYFNYFNKEVKE